MLGPINRMDATNSRDWNQAAMGTATSADKSTSESTTVQIVKEEKQQLEESQESQKEKMFKEIEKLNEQMKATNRSFRFKYSEEADKFYVQVIDVRSQEVVESLPPEYMIDLSAKLKELIGLFVDKKL
ncbi:flagellar protein FlaG [Paenibacillus oenotherae]|uniref:Flagellar protein FlaG n=1 Tax=Paenibacillus oenotherae TaxID=1435645 RepID=A0ABS7D525_9BACL|nr:flagellar protein FlaG [Paenibacillus oenotherae]MBW7474990.1 flagellar protein FlaG [Paenibacillus oenotherae]